MIHELEIKNFEGFEHVLLKGFHKHFNLLCGISNAGKTSIARAICLVSYNSWNPKSLRLGKKYCTVKLTTERGSVTVERGKSINRWTVEQQGGKTLKFEKPGKGIITEAADVIGLKVVQLGSREVRPNVMDQLGAHFLLAEVDGENASGSVRAQIVDEISGLAGMEELIREVGLDNIRNGREIKKTEEDINELEKRKHDEKVIASEEALLNQVEGLINKAEETKEKSENAKEMFNRITVLATELADNYEKLKSFPDIDAVSKRIEKVVQVLQSMKEIRDVNQQFSSKFFILKRNKQVFSAIPDVSQVTLKLKDSEKKLQHASQAKQLFDTWNKANKESQRQKKELETCEKSCVSKQIELDKTIKSVDLCPICLKPVHKGCDAYCEERK